MLGIERLAIPFKEIRFPLQLLPSVSMAGWFVYLPLRLPARYMTVDESHMSASVRLCL